MTRFLVVNADDFGYSPGINRGILECHTNGIVTSTSCMVTGYAVEEAAAISADHPDLSVGLHWDVFGEDERTFDLEDVGAVRDEFNRQLDGSSNSSAGRRLTSTPTGMRTGSRR